MRNGNKSVLWFINSSIYNRLWEAEEMIEPDLSLDYEKDGDIFYIRSKITYAQKSEFMKKRDFWA